MRKTHDWYESLAKGKKGEILFLSLTPDIKPIDSGRKSDFISTKTNTKYELKSDYYDMSTGNFFIERWSKAPIEATAGKPFIPGVPGGPYQAKEKGSHVYVYFFIQNRTVFYFNVDKLLAKLETLNLDVDFKLCSVQNEGYTTQGYKIPRELLSDVLLKKVIYDY